MNFYNFKWVFLVVLIPLCMHCEQNRDSATRPEAFFDLDSLLDAQVQVLTSGDYALKKSVQMDGKDEQITRVPDSAGWQAEFVILRDFDLNKPNNVGAYDIKSTDEVIRYERSADIDSPVKMLEVVKSDGQVSRISSNYFEDKSIYQHHRQLVLEFEQGLLKNYSVKGFQKMIMKDTISYIISGEVVVQ